MKKLIVFIIIPFIFGCEDVIEVDAPGEAPRLIVDALIRATRTMARRFRPEDEGDDASD